MNIAFAINERYLQHFFVTLKSIEINCIETVINIHVMYIDFNEKNIKFIQQEFPTFKFIWHNLNKYDFNDFFINAHISYETYFRIIAPEIIREERILYLDSDLIIRDNLDSLYFAEVESYAVAACKDYKAQNRKINLNIPKEAPYFNAGVLLMNLDYWRKYDLTTKLIEYIHSMKSKLIYWDQDALNALLYNQVLILEDKWNVQTASFESRLINQDVLLSPNIIHFTGASKPWHISNNNQFKQEYYKYLALTLFKNFDVVTEETKQLMQKKRKIYIWGAGSSGKAVYEYLKINIQGFIDSNIERVGTTYLENPIYSIDQIEKTEEVGILVCSGYFNDIAKILEANGYRKNIDFVHQM